MVPPGIQVASGLDGSGLRAFDDDPSTRIKRRPFTAAWDE
jgi:hypothetical protein